MKTPTERIFQIHIREISSPEFLADCMLKAINNNSKDKILIDDLELNKTSLEETSEIFGQMSTVEQQETLIEAITTKI